MFSRCRRSRAVGLLGCWAVGLLGCWDVGLLGCWDVGMLGCWDVGMLGCWATQPVVTCSEFFQFFSCFEMPSVSPLQDERMAFYYTGPYFFYPAKRHIIPHSGIRTPESAIRIRYAIIIYPFVSFPCCFRHKGTKSGFSQFCHLRANGGPQHRSGCDGRPHHGY